MKKYLTFLILVLSLSCKQDTCNMLSTIGYNLNLPNETIVLPDILHEVSGITMLNDSTIACVQDENGILFIYDFIKKEIVEEYEFNENGDYEGIAKAENTIYILQSDATIFEISNFGSNSFKTTVHQTDIPAKNNEGLCYDKQNNRLLIGAKSKIAKGKENKDKRGIFAFNLKTKAKETELVFEFDINDIEKFAKENKMELPKSKKYKNKKGEKPLFKLRKSAIAIHPITNELYVLSAVEHILYIFDFQGNIKHIILLDKDLFNKAEGITFLDNADMLISNEGVNTKPTILRFNYKK